jgi:hypothetical protein
MKHLFSGTENFPGVDVMSTIFCDFWHFHWFLLFYSHLVFMAVSGDVSQFGMLGPRKIWQPCWWQPRIDPLELTYLSLRQDFYLDVEPLFAPVAHFADCWLTSNLKWYLSAKEKIRAKVSAPFFSNFGAILFSLLVLSQISRRINSWLWPPFFLLQN